MSEQLLTEIRDLLELAVKTLAHGQGRIWRSEAEDRAMIESALRRAQAIVDEGNPEKIAALISHAPDLSALQPHTDAPLLQVLEKRLRALRTATSGFRAAT